MKYTEVQIDFVMNEKANGKTYNQIKDSFNKKFKKDVSYAIIRKIYRHYCDQYEFTEIIDPHEVKTQKAKQKLIDLYYKFVKENHKRPNEFQLRTKGGGSATNLVMSTDEDEVYHVWKAKARTAVVDVYLDNILEGSKTDNLPTEKLHPIPVHSINSGSEVHCQYFEAYNT